MAGVRTITYKPAMPHDAVMFDLDGTLADTLADIAACGNFALAQLGEAPLPTHRYRKLAGQGARFLVREALHTTDDDPRVDEGLAAFRAYQLEHGSDLTRPYDGVTAALDALAAAGAKLAVLSNKPHAATVPMVERVFARWRFAVVRGHVDGTPLKPDPTTALQLAAEMGVAPGRVLYVGDTDVDMQTAKAAGFTAVGVLWGFRDEAELRSNGADHVITHPRELPALR